MDEKSDFDEFAPWLVLFLALIGGGLRAFMIGTSELRLAEIFSLWLSNHSLGEMLHWIVAIDQHPPLFYLLLHYWVKFIGTTPYDLRLLSVLLGAGTIPVIYLIGKRLSGAVMGVAAAILLAFSPINIRFAHDLRMYTLLVFNSSVAIYALVWLLTDSRSLKPIGSQFREFFRKQRTPAATSAASGAEFSYNTPQLNQRSWRARLFGRRWPSIQPIETDLAWVIFIVFSVASLLSDNTAVLFLLAANIFVIGLMLYQRLRKPGSQPTFQAPSFWSWLIAQAIIFVLWSPWMYGFIQQAGRIYQEFLIPPPSWESVVQVISSYLNAFMPGQATVEKIFRVIYALVLCLGLVHYLKRMPRFVFLAALFIVPILGEIIVSLRQPIFSAWTLLWTTIPLFLLLAAGIAQLRIRLLIIVAIGILGANNLFSTGDYFRYMPREDWSDVAGYVAKYAEKGDLILFNATWVQIPFDNTFTVYERQYFLEVEKHGVPVDLFASDIPEPRMMENDLPGLNSLLSGHKRVWLVYTHNHYTDPQGLIPQTLAAELKMAQERIFNMVDVQLYTPP